MKTLKVLIVEDDQATRTLIEEVLEEASKKYKCDLYIDSVGNGEYVVELHKGKSYDLIIIDLILPNKITGLSIIREIRSFDKICEFIIITGFPTIENAIEAINLNVWFYFVKPFDFSALVEQSHKAIENSILKAKILSLSKLASKIF